MTINYPSRRSALHLGALPLLGIDLPTVLAANESGKPRKAKACIFIFLWGGPAQQDTLDPKPDAPVEYRGEFSTIQTALPGVRVCEHLPGIASRLDKVCMIRSMTHSDVNHTTAPHLLLTGHPIINVSQPLREDFPGMSSVLARLGRGASSALPPAINLMPHSPDKAPRFVESTHGQGSGWLGPVWQPMRIDADPSSPGYSIGEITPAIELAGGRMAQRAGLVHDLERSISNMSADAMAQGRHHDQAMRLLSNRKAAEAFDLSREPMAVRERYGMNIHGQAVLQARRLVEAGVPLITVYWQNDGITNVSVYWDTHQRNFIDLKNRLCPPADKALCALLDDLEARGMLDETLVVWSGEMGRTPRVGQSVPGGAGAGRDGRDHWAKVFSCIVAGGGFRKGHVYGSSDRYAAEPSTSPVPPADLVATLYHQMGVDPHTVITDRLGREVPLVHGEILKGLLN
jgi:uncharacterized protein (DUF1501 family)